MSLKHWLATVQQQLWFRQLPRRVKARTARNRRVSQRAEMMEVRAMLSNNDLIVELQEQAGEDAQAYHGQVVYLDFDGAENVDYNGPVTVTGLSIPAFDASPVGLSGHESEIISSVVDTLNMQFQSLQVSFTAEQPGAGAYSTIYIGGDDSAFSQYGSFLGLAEQVDSGNQDRSDNAFVFSETIIHGHLAVADYTAELTDVISHESAHLLGYHHTPRHASSAEGILADVADQSLSWSQRQSILTGLQAIVDSADRLGDLDELSALLPVIGTRIGETFDLRQVLEAGLYQPVSNYFAGSVATADGLAAILQTVDLLDGSFHVKVVDGSASTATVTTESSTELRFSLELAASDIELRIPIELGTDETSFILDPNAMNEIGQVVNPTATVDLQTNAGMNLTFGIDLDPALSPDEAFFADLGDLSIRVNVNESALNSDIRVGLLDAQVVNGTVTLDAQLTAAFANPNDAGSQRFNLNTLQSESIENIATIVEAASPQLNVNLPVMFDFAGFSNATAGISPTIGVSTSDLFSGTQPTIALSEFDELLLFNNLGPVEVVGAIDQFAIWWDNLAESPTFATPLQFRHRAGPGRRRADKLRSAASMNAGLMTYAVNL